MKSVTELVVEAWNEIGKENLGVKSFPLFHQLLTLLVAKILLVKLVVVQALY